MTITTTWKINDMVRDNSTGGVNTAYWECRVQNKVGTDGFGNPLFDECGAVEGGKLRLTPDASASDFIPYESLKESDVLGWVYNSLIEGDETADEAKARIEKVRQDKVTAQVASKTTEASGMPW